MILRPNPGPQEAFLSCDADIAIYGGGAGGGKTVALLMDQARWAATIPKFAGVIFRRTYPQIMNPGALWDESLSLFPAFGGEPVRSDAKWIFPKTGSWIKFSHLQREDDILAWQGAQVAVASYDELTHFSSQQFFYMMSRMRSVSGINPYMRGSCNPDPMSWVAAFIGWWLDDHGLPIAERAGKKRYMARKNGVLLWGDSPAEIEAVHGVNSSRSVTFVPALLKDNPILTLNNPDYAAQLQALTAVDRARLADGNWKVVPVAGSFFKRHWFKVFHRTPPLDLVRSLRCWDRAATEVSEQSSDPDWTAGVKIGLRANGTPVLLDCIRLRGTPGTVRDTIRATAQADGQQCEILLSQDPGQAGVVEIAELVKALGGFAVQTYHERGSKAERAKPLSVQCEHGNVEVCAGPWLDPFLREAEAFLDERECRAPTGYHDDQIDATSGAYNFLMSAPIPDIH